MRRTARTAVVVAALAASVSACGASATSSAPGNATTPSLSSTPATHLSGNNPTASAGTALPSDAPTFSFPIDAYTLDGADLYTIEEAQDQLANQCMSRFGFPPATPSLDRDAMVAEQQESEDRLYGIDSLTEAKTYGYVPEVYANAKLAKPPTESTAWTFVETGSKTGSDAPSPGGWKSPGKFGGLAVPPGGCMGEARTKLWGSPDTQVKDQLAQDLRDSSFNQSMADPRVQALFAQWSACMAQQGYHYQTPFEPKFNRPDNSSPSATEVNTAVADVTCKHKIDMVEKWNAVNLDYQNQAIEKNQLALTDERNTIQAALKKATAVLNGND